MAADVGVSGEELYRLARYSGAPSELLPQRLELLGIDAEYVRQAMPTTFRDLARVCAACQASRRCRRDLARGDVQAGQVNYCLNGLTIDVLTLNWTIARSPRRRGGRHEVVDDASGRTTGNAHA